MQTFVLREKIIQIFLLDCVSSPFTDLDGFLVVQKKALLQCFVNAVHIHKTAAVAGEKTGEIVNQFLEFLESQVCAQNSCVCVKLDSIVKGVCL